MKKRFIVTLLTMLLIVTTALFVSCKKDEDESTVTSETVSVSESLSKSESTSQSQSQSESHSQSESISESHSQSESISQSESVSESQSQSESISQSESVSESQSQSESISQSESVSESHSQSESTSESQSEVPHVHSFGSWETVRNATCTDDGEEKRTCSCGASETRPITAFGHTFTDKVVTLDYLKTSATCVDVAIYYYSCKDCGEKGESTFEHGNALGHNWDYDAQTCEHGQTCLRDGCGATTPILQHNYQVTSIISPDCVNDGQIVKTCTYCEDEITLRDTEHLALGHNYGTNKECEVITEVFANDITGEGCLFKIEHKCHCDTCDEDVVLSSTTEHKHEYVSTITKEMNCHEKGVMTYTCNNCKYSYNEDIAIDENAHVWDDGDVKPGQITYKCTCQGCSATKTVINAKSETEATVSKDDLKNSAIELSTATIQLDENTLKGLDGTDVAISAEINDTVKSTLSSELQEQIGDNPIYDFKIGGGSMQFDGTVTVTIEYTLKQDEDVGSIAIWYINENNEVTSIPATYSNGYVTFTTNHFSYYTVTELTPKERCETYGHPYAVKTVAPTCTTEGYTLKVCQRCGNVEKTDIIPALGHDLKCVTENATCVRNGKNTYTCTHEGCRYSYSEVIVAEGHDFILLDSKAATCSEAGYESYKCEHCQEQYKTILNKLAHTYKDEVVEPTCTTGGYTIHTCDVCGHTYRDSEKQPKGHVYDKTVVKATCTTDGYTQYKCKYCDEEYTDNVVTAHHVWDIDEPTCSQGQTCLVCGEHGLSATGLHNMVNGVCTVCGEGCSHNFEDVETKATCTTKGFVTHTCTLCGYSYTDGYVDALGHTVEQGLCERCGKTVYGDDFYYELFESFLSSDYMLTVTDFNELSEYEYYDGRSGETTRVMMNFGEVSIGYTKERGLYGFGQGTVLVEDVDKDYERPNSAIFAYENGVIYVKVLTNANGGSIGWENGRQETDTKTLEEYVILPTKDASFLTFGSDTNVNLKMVAELIPTVFDWIEDDLKPFVENVKAINKDKAVELSDKLMSYFATKTESDGGYAITVNWENLKTLVNTLADGTIREFYEEFMGEGAFDELVESVETLLDMTIGDMLDTLADKGFDIDALLQVANSLVYKVTDGEIVSVDQFVSQMAGAPISVKDIIYDEQFASMKLLDLVSLVPVPGGSGEKYEEKISQSDNIIIESVEEQIEGPTIPSAEEIVAMLASLGEVNIFDILGSAIPMTKEELKASASGIIDMISTSFVLTLNADNEGKFKDLTLGIDYSNESEYYTSEYNDELESGELEYILDYINKQAVQGNFVLSHGECLHEDYALMEEEINSLVGGLGNINNVILAWADYEKSQWNRTDHYYNFDYVYIGRDYQVIKDADGRITKINTVKSREDYFGMEYFMSRYSQEEMQEELFNVAQSHGIEMTDVDDVRTTVILEQRLSYIFPKNAPYAFVKDCTGIYMVDMLVGVEYENTCYMLVELVNVDGEIILSEKMFECPYDEDSQYYYGDIPTYGNGITNYNIDFIYNADGGETVYDYYYESSHNYIATEEVEPTGCTGWGYTEYTCSICGNTYRKYVRNGHSDFTYEYEFLGDSENCDDGVKIHKVCGVCGEQAGTETYYGHRIFEQTIDLSEYGYQDCKIVVDACPCGQRMDGIYFDCDGEIECDYFHIEDREIYYEHSDLYPTLYIMVFRVENYDGCFCEVYGLVGVFDIADLDAIKSGETPIPQPIISYESDYDSYYSHTYYGPDEQYSYEEVKIDGVIYTATRTVKVYQCEECGMFAGIYESVVYEDDDIYYEEYYDYDGENCSTIEGFVLTVKTINVYRKVTVNGEVYNIQMSNRCENYEEGELSYWHEEIYEYEDGNYCKYVCHESDSNGYKYTYQGESHQDTTYEYKLKEGATSCEEGVLEIVHCSLCNQIVKEYEYHEHMIIKENIDFSKYGSDGYLMIDSCVCGEYVYYDYNFKGYTTHTPNDYDEDGKHYYVEVETDGILRLQKVYYKERGENCLVTTYYEVTLSTADNDLICYFEYTNTSTEHDYYVVDAYLMDGAKSCNDGVILTYECQYCGDTYTTDAYWHEEYEVERIDVSSYGCNCGGYAVVYSCACGKTKAISLNEIDCEFDRVETQDGDIFTCAVTDPQCGFAIRVYEEYVLRDIPCVYYKDIHCQFGYNKVSKTYEYEYVLHGNSYKVTHNYTYSEDEGEEDGYRVVTYTYTCQDCGSVKKETYYYDGDTMIRSIKEYTYTNSLYDDYKHIKKVQEYMIFDENQYETSYVDTYEDWDGNIETYVRSYNYEYDFVVPYGDPYYKLTRYDSNDYYPNYEVAYFKYMGYTYIMYQDGYDDYGNGYRYSYSYNFDGTCERQVSYDEYRNGKSCSSWIEYEDCHRRIWISGGEPTCTQFGNGGYTCAVCGNSLEECEVYPLGHNFVYSEEDGVYECTHCGLKNVNGASGEVVLEDMTENDEYYKVGYWNQGHVQYLYYIALVVGDDEVLLDGIKIYNSEDSVSKYFSKAEVTAKAEEMGYEKGEYQVKFVFVPLGADGSYDYAIIFEDKDTGEWTQNF